MLNIKSLFGRVSVWLAIAGLWLWVIADAAGLGGLWGLWRLAFDSQIMGDLQRVQNLIAIPVAALAAWLAYNFNNKLEREKESIKSEAEARGLARAIVFELLEVANEAESRVYDCYEMSRNISARMACGNEQIVAAEKLKSRLPIQDMLLRKVEVDRLGKLGYNAYGAARLIRLTLRNIEALVSEAPEGSIQAKEMVRFLDCCLLQFSSLALECRRYESIFSEVENAGASAGDNCPPAEAVSKLDVEANITRIIQNWSKARRNLRQRGELFE